MSGNRWGRVQLRTMWITSQVMRDHGQVSELRKANVLASDLREAEKIVSEDAVHFVWSMTTDGIPE